MGAVSPQSVVSGVVEELYDYDTIRQSGEPSMFEVRPDHTTLVLGSSQSMDLLDPRALHDVDVRRRRGGGGLVVLHPRDLWIDWWIPATDDRWSSDLHESSLRAGEWWRESLRPETDAEMTVHEGSLEGEPAHRVVCFAGRGPGEVFVAGRKTVGVTQWRVREGIFVSTVLPVERSNEALGFLATVPPGLDGVLENDVSALVKALDRTRIIDRLTALSGPWQYRKFQLNG